MDRDWGVVVAKPRSELKAIINLTNQGYECYCPMVRESIKRQGKTAFVERALFPRYLFIHIVGVWRSILGTFGVSGMLLDGEKPALMGSNIIGALKTRENALGFVVLPEKRAAFKRGRKVRVENGPFQGSFALVEGMPSHERVLVLMQVLGRETRVEFGAVDLAVEGEFGFAVPQSVGERLKLGAEVLIEHGTMQGARASVEKVLSRGRVIVLMGVLGQETRVEVAAGDLSVV